jgi:hypothetical protein
MMTHPRGFGVWVRGQRCLAASVAIPVGGARVSERWLRLRGRARWATVGDGVEMGP